jgi:hypothetical protein
MAQPIVIDASLLVRLRARVHVLQLLLDDHTELNLEKATHIETILSGLHNTLHVALKRVNEPQNDAPAMPNDVHGGQSRG